MNALATISPLLLAPAALVAAAAPAPLPPAAEQELAELDAYLAHDALPPLREMASDELARAFEPELAECRELIARFRRSGKVTECSARHRLTMLHLACLGRKLELVRALLAAGADPNALAGTPDDNNMVRYGGLDVEQWLDTPLVSCVHDVLPGLAESDAATRLALINMLAAAGAEVKGKAGGHAVLICGTQPISDAGAEQVALHLLDLGADPARNGYVDPHALNWCLCNLVHAGRTRLLERLAATGFLKGDSPCIFPYSSFDSGGGTLLGVALRDGLYMRLHPDAMDAQAAGVAVLLRLGADLHQADDAGATPADLIHAQPLLLARLQARGFAIPPTPRELRAGSLREDLDRLPADAWPPTEQLAPHTAALAALLTEGSGDPDSIRRCCLALRFLWRLDAAQTMERVRTLPLWQDKEAWQVSGAARALYTALMNEECVCMPTDWLLQMAEELDAAGHARAAHQFVHLMARNADALPVVEGLCTDTRPALASAAWGARLQLAHGIAPLPQSWFMYLNHWQLRGKEVARRVKRLAWAMSALGRLGPHGHFLDLGMAGERTLFGQSCPGLTSHDFVHATSRFYCWPDDEQELVGSLREMGAADTADAVAELFRLRHESWAEETQASTADNTAPDEDYEEPDAADFSEAEQRRQRAQAQLNALMADREFLTRHAFAIEAALGRLLWELHQKETK